MTTLGTAALVALTLGAVAVVLRLVVGAVIAGAQRDIDELRLEMEEGFASAERRLELLDGDVQALSEAVFETRPSPFTRPDR